MRIWRNLERGLAETGRSEDSIASVLLRGLRAQVEETGLVISEDVHMPTDDGPAFYRMGEATRLLGVDGKTIRRLMRMEPPIVPSPIGDRDRRLRVLSQDQFGELQRRAALSPKLSRSPRI